MSKSEMIKWLQNLKKDIGQSQHQDLWHYAEMLDEVIGTIEVSEDCISRDYVRLIESDEDAYYGDWNETYEKGFSDALDKVLDAPSVVPTDKCKVCQQYDIGYDDGRLDMLQKLSNALISEGKNEQSD